MDLTRTVIDELFPAPDKGKKGSSACETIQARVNTLAHSSTLAAVEAAAKRARRCGRYGRLTTRDVEHSIEGERPLFVLAAQAAFIKSETVDTVGKILCLGEPDVDLSQMPEPGKLPVAPTFTVHWLAVDGKQPAIAENHAEEPLASSVSQASSDLALSRELQLYLDRVVDTVSSNQSVDASERLQALLSALSTDAGLDRLTPHLVRLCAERVASNLKNLPALFTSVRLAAALVRNSHLTNLDLYLHELCPAVLTCCLGKRLCASMVEDHWDLRIEAANVVAAICDRFGSSYSDLQLRIVKTLSDSLLSNPPRPLTTQFGAIVTLSRLGTEVIDRYIEPLVLGRTDQGQFMTLLEDACNLEVNPEDANADASFARKSEATRVMHAIKQAALKSSKEEFRAMAFKDDLNALGRVVSIDPLII